MRVLFALPGFHRVSRGAEIALESVAAALAREGDIEVTLAGSGKARTDTPYSFIHAGAVDRGHFERLSRVPGMGNLYGWEDMTFAATASVKINPHDFDITVTCSYPFSNWMLRRHSRSQHRAAHVFVTQNGDWPAQSTQRRFRLFSCDGLVCTNPIYFERNRRRWPSALIPNGVDVTRFNPGPNCRDEFGLSTDRPVVLVVSALIRSKRVPEAIRAAARLDDVHVIVAGDGPERSIVDDLAHELLPDRYTRLTVPAHRMPDLYRSADVLLHMSRDESFGNIYLEGPACGLPVVAHRTPTTEWILGDNVGLVDTEREDDVAAALRTALERGAVDLASWERVAQRFDWPVVAKQYRSFFEDIT